MRAFPLALIALALLAGTAGYVGHQWYSKTPRATAAPPVENTPLPAAEPPVVARPDVDPLQTVFLTPDGVEHRLSDWPGELVVLNFWATWCAPCLREIPAFIALQQRYAGQGVQFIGIALDQPDAVASFVAEKNLNYPTVVGEDDVIRLMSELGNSIGGMPYSVVLQNGAPVFAHQGEWEAAEAEQTLLDFLKKL